MQLNLEQLRLVVLKKLANIVLVVTLVISGLGMLGTPAIADSQTTLAIAVNRQDMAATQNRASNYAQSKQDLDQEFENVVSDVKEDLQKATNTTVETVKKMADVDSSEVNSSAKQSQNRAAR